jgi:hypothetical protein
MTLVEGQETRHGGHCQCGDLEDWLLTSLQRGNPATVLDERHADKAAWSTGNQVRPLVHGAVYFAELLAGVSRCEQVTHCCSPTRADPDELLAGAGSEVSRVLCAAARRAGLRPDVAVSSGPAEFQRAGEPASMCGHRGSGRQQPARHAGAARRLAPSEVRRAAPSGPPRAGRGICRLDRPVSRPPRRRRARGGRAGRADRGRLRGPATVA